MATDTIVVMIPALNEEESIGSVIDALPCDALSSKGYETRMIVVDGNSTDRTCAIAQERGAGVLVQGGRGKGIGVRQAFSICGPPEHMEAIQERPPIQGLTALVEARYVIMLDADGTYPPEHILDIVEMLESGTDVVMGSRFMGTIHEGAMTTLNRFGNIVLSDVASILYRHPCTDLCTGMWGFNAAALKALELDSRHFELEAELFAESLRKGLKVDEVAISYLPRKGETKLVPWKAGFAILSKLLERRFWSAAGEFDMRMVKSPEPKPASRPSRQT